MADETSDTQDIVLNAIDAGLIVLDRHRRIVRWNTWMASASGKSAAEVHGKPLVQVFPPPITGAGMEKLDAAIGFALNAGASSILTNALHPRLFPLRTRAGRELLHDVTVFPVSLREDEACLIHVADITMAALRERFLRERQNTRYDAVVANAPDVILTLDGDGVIRHANPAAAVQFGYSTEELVGQHAGVLFERQVAWTNIWHALRSGESIPQPAELVARRKDGSESYLEVSASNWRIDSRIFVTAFLRDVNERRKIEAALRVSESHARATAHDLADLNATLEQRVRDRSAQLMQAEEALRQSQKMEAIGQLTGGIAHDFNNLLQGIVGTLEMIEKRLRERRIGDTDRLVQGALASANRASALTHRLLAFSRQQPVDPRPLNVNHLIGSIEELLRRSIGETLKMTVVDATDLWLVRCDANQLENALLNLAINARDAMPDGGALTIATSNTVLDASQALMRDVKAGEYVRLAISDTGIGMPLSVQSRAFDPFYTTKPIGQGTGLGLSMIYGFVRQSEGAVRIESEVGRGTLIEICLPRFTGDAGVETSGQNGISVPRRGKGGEVVLVVEDEDIVRLFVVEVLKDLGYLALEAVDGASGLRILQSAQRIDLLATDVGLPDINGRHLADTARVNRPDLKILFMTGYAQNAAGNSFLSNGMEIISKPFTMDSFAAKIRQMIEQ
jgi:PAS domain S-box-containing protein